MVYHIIIIIILHRIIVHDVMLLYSIVCRCSRRTPALSRHPPWAPRPADACGRRRCPSASASASMRAREHARAPAPATGGFAFVAPDVSMAVSLGSFQPLGGCDDGHFVRSSPDPKRSCPLLPPAPAASRERAALGAARIARAAPGARLGSFFAPSP
jgi:hypothetical protein